jgi:hypothetical protein
MLVAGCWGIVVLDIPARAKRSRTAQIGADPLASAARSAPDTATSTDAVGFDILGR